MRDAVEGRHIGFDIKDWCSFKKIQAGYMECAPIDLIEGNVGYPDWVGTVEVAGGKNPVGCLPIR